MLYGYSAENHDWDLTLRAAWNLLMSGQAVDHLPTPGSNGEKEFSCFTGSMLLSFCSIESFSASVAFSMPKTTRFENFDFDRYRRAQRFWDKLDLIFQALDHPVDKSGGLFQTISEMQIWRNLVAHASPFEIEETPIADTTEAPGKLHARFQHKDYTRQVGLAGAQKFYGAAYDYIELLTGLSGLEPRASVSYKPKADG